MSGRVNSLEEEERLLDRTAEQTAGESTFRWEAPIETKDRDLAIAVHNCINVAIY